MPPIGHQYRRTVDFIPGGISAAAAPVVPREFTEEGFIMQHTDRRDFLKLAGLAGVTFTAGLFPRRARRRAGQRLPLRAVLRHPLGLQGSGQPRRRAHAREGRGDRERPRPEARLHRLHRRPHPHHRGRQAAARAHEALQGDRLGARRQGRALHAGRARRLARQGRGLSRSSSAPRTSPSTTRACTSSPSTTSPTRPRSWATSSSPGWPPTSSSARPTTASSC